MPLSGVNVYSPSTPVPRTLTLDVGRVYWLNIGTVRTQNMTLNINPPAGYEVHVIDQNSTGSNAVSREYKFPTVDGEPGWDGRFSSIIGISIAPENTSASGGQAGSCTALSTSGAAWRIFMGYLPNGLSAGYLELTDHGRAAVGFTDAFVSDALAYTPPSSDIVVHTDGGGGRNIFAYEAGVAIQLLPIPAVGYTVKFYHNSQVTDNVLSGPAFSGTPFMVYTIQRDGAATNLKITRAATGPTTTVTKVASIGRTGSGWPGYTFTVADWHTDGQPAIVTATTVLSAGTGALDHNESIILASTAGGTPQVSSAQFLSKAYGEVPVFNQSGTASAQTRAASYYESDTTLIGAYARPKLVTGNNGSWEAYEYFSSTFNLSGGQAQFNNTGMVKRSHRPYKDTSAPSAGDDLSTRTAGVITTYQYQSDAYTQVNGLALRPSDELTTIDGVTVAHASTSYVDESTSLSYAGVVLPLVTATRTDYSSASGPLTTVTKYFREYSVSTQTLTMGQYFGTDPFWRKQIHSLQKPDGTKQVYAYQRGTYSGGTFGLNSTTSPFATQPGVSSAWANRSVSANPASASRIAVISGTSNATNPDGSNNTPYSSYAGYPVDSVYLISGKSTLNITIRDLSALVRRTETWVWLSGDFRLVSFEDISYDAANNLVSKVSSTGATYTAVFDGGRKISEIDASGVEVIYGYDDAGRVFRTTKMGVSGQADLRTDYICDAAGRTVSEDVYAVGGIEHVINLRTYDDAGRPASETKPAQATTSYSYTPTANQVSVTLPNTGTRVEISYPDGQKKQVTGTGVVPQYFSYDVQSGGVRHTLVNIGSAASARVQETWTDWLGRTTKTSHPTRVGSTPGAFIETQVYHSTTGLLSKSTRTDASANRLLADTLYAYDAVGQLIRTTQDINNDGSLNLGGTDRVTDTDQYFELIGADYWLTKQTVTYPTAGSSAPQLVNTTRQRLTGLSSTFQGETKTTDIDGNVAATTITVNRTAKTTTTSTTLTGYTNAQAAVSVNGLPATKTGFDGLTYTTQYDDLQRPNRSVDALTRTTTTTYKAGTVMPYQIVDPALNPVATYTYDTAGRVVAQANAAGKLVRSEYNPRDQVLHQWGEATYPVEYVYDGFGQRTEMHTYQTESGWTDVNWPASVTPASVTIWAYDEATGLLLTKTNVVSPTNQVVTTDYNARGQTWHHTGGRGLTTTFGYDDQTGELLSKMYSDSTPAVAYTYTRAGLTLTATDVTGVQQFNYAVSQPQRLNTITLNSYYGSRTQTLTYDAVYRPNGFVLGAGSELTQTATYSDLGRFDHLDTARSGQASVTYTYSYKSSSPLLAGYTTGSFAASRDYETNRDLVTKVEAQWAGASRTRYDALYNALAQRSSVKQSGTAFADYGASTYYRDTYDDRGELTVATGYLGEDATATTSPLPGRDFNYDYDAIGNRKTVSRTGVTGLPDTYLPNALNQYDSRQNRYVYAAGTVAGSAVSVGVSGGVAPPVVSRQGGYWFARLQLDNTGHPKQDTVTLAAARPGTPDLVRTQTVSAQVPAAAQNFVHDADGNLTNDGVWSYEWDAENRLKRMETTATAISYGVAGRVLAFHYDALDRRVQKRVTDIAGITEYSSRRYLYDGWNLVAEFSAPGGTTIGSMVRSYTWGLDLAGSRTATGGVGALMQIADYASGKNYLPTYDTNGNIAALLNAATGAVAAVYEYSPWGEVLHAETADVAIADNPFQFSTKFTDAETGLVYYGHRYYSPSLGRFINRDPIAESGGINLYGFVRNDPTNRWDVLGYTDQDRIILEKMIIYGAHEGGGASGLSTRFTPFRVNRPVQVGKFFSTGDHRYLPVRQNGDVYEAYQFDPFHSVVKVDVEIDAVRFGPSKLGTGQDALAGMAAELANALGALTQIALAASHPAAWMIPRENFKFGDKWVTPWAARHGINVNSYAYRTFGPGFLNTATLAMGGVGLVESAPTWIGRIGAAENGVMFSKNLGSAGPRASGELLDAMRAHGRTITIATKGSEELRFLNAMGAEASVGGPQRLSILLRENPSQAAAIEEFLHGTQTRLGIVDRLGVQGAEAHVESFMTRYSKLLGLEPK